MKNITYVIILGLLFVGCRRYKENEGLTMKSPKKRIEGTWMLSYMAGEEYPKIESENSGYITDECGNSWLQEYSYYESYEFRFEKTGVLETSYINLYSYTDEYSTYYACKPVTEDYDYSDESRSSWDFFLAKNYLDINGEMFEINKLTEEELIITSSTWGERIEFVKK